jgi:pyridoxal phosphate enzyme (YggS family)
LSSPLQHNLELVRDRIEQARGRSPHPGNARLLAITKRNSAALAHELFELGVCDLGENRLESFEHKRAWFAQHAPDAEVRWHFIGHLQRNKARKVVALADEIHSVDSLRLLETLERICREEGVERRIYLQVKLTDEPNKHGLDPEDLPRALALAATCRNARPAGLMCMAAPAVDDSGQQAARAVFERLAELAHEASEVSWTDGRPLLSMGMSADYEVAAECGSDWLRVGSAIFAGVEDSNEEGRSHV